MDRKSVIILVISLALLFAWPAMVGLIFPPTPIPPGQTNVLDSVTNRLDPKVTPASPPSTAMAPVTRPVPVVPAEVEETLTLENEQARFTFTSHGGGIKFVELKKYPATVQCRNKD